MCYHCTDSYIAYIHDNVKSVCKCSNYTEDYECIDSINFFINVLRRGISFIGCDINEGLLNRKFHYTNVYTCNCL
jgi:hypothetical protein